MNANPETVLGMALGVLTAGFLWYRSSNSNESKAPKARKSLRDFTANDLSVYDGKQGRLAYVALCEPEDGVYDVSRDSSGELAEYAGREVSKKVDADKIKSNYEQVGKLIRPRDITVDELFENDGRNNKPIWLSAKGEVFDVTRGRDFYGPESGYAIMAGRDASRALALMSLNKSDVDNNRIDDLSAADIMTLDEWRMKFHTKYTCLGSLKGWSPAGSPMPAKISGAVPSATANGTPAKSTEEAQETFLTRERQQVKLAEKIQLSPDTWLFKFALPKPNMRLGLPIGKHIKFWCPNPKPKVPGEWNGKPDAEFGKPEIERKYTPSMLDSECKGHFEVVIKVYRPNQSFCDGGKMSQFFGDMNVGDVVDVAGPFGLIEYKGNGKFTISKKEVSTKMLGLMAGGTGLTPMLQLIKAIMYNPDDTTRVSLLFANQTENDILLRDMLEDLQRKNSERFKLHYTLDRPPKEGWQYSSGFITEEMINANMPPPGPETLIFACGPPPMIKFACKANLEKATYEMSRFAEF
jgi:cytochrome-b5 reductase